MRQVCYAAPGAAATVAAGCMTAAQADDTVARGGHLMRLKPIRNAVAAAVKPGGTPTALSMTVLMPK